MAIHSHETHCKLQHDNKATFLYSGPLLRLSEIILKIPAQVSIVPFPLPALILYYRNCPREIVVALVFVSLAPHVRFVLPGR